MKKLKVAIVRGKHLNNFELQSYTGFEKNIDFTLFGSKTSIHQKFPFSVQRLFSPVDVAHWGSQVGIPYRYLLGLLNRLFVDAHYLVGLEKKLKGFDIAHTADTYYHYTRQCLEAKRRGIVKKVVATAWETIPFNNEGIWGRHEFKQRAIKEIDHFIATSQQAKETLITEGCEPKKITVIYPGIDSRRFKPIKARKEVRNILFVGRLVKEKGVWLIFEAFKRLNKKFPEIRLRFCGEGEEKVKLLHEIRRNHLENVIEVKSARYEEMPQVYESADLFVLASLDTKHWKEQFGMVLIEAMSRGLPIIATNTGAIPEVVGSSGIIVHPNFSDTVSAFEDLIIHKSKRLNYEDQELLGYKKYLVLN